MNRFANLPRLGAFALAAALLVSLPHRADEGMWTYDHPPVPLLQERYGFTPPPGWFDHLRLSSVNVYASASFVSADGLILTNHHVTLGWVQRLSTPEHNYVRDGFTALTLQDELPVAGASVSVLVSMEDVTARVNAAVKAGVTPAEAEAQRRTASAAIEAECVKARGLKGRVVSLFGGSKRVLYVTKDYTDIRLVFTPELAAAFFGGDDDNFTYPRYDLDMSFVRAYENGKPARVQDFLQTNPQGASDGDLVFVSGHPGRTERLQTLAMLELQRDVTAPETLDRLKARRQLLKTYGARGPEQARRARTTLYFMENAIKSREGELRGLQDAALMKKKAGAEMALRTAVSKDPALGSAYGRAWARAEEAVAWSRAHDKDRQYKMTLGDRGLFGTALRLVRYAQESAKPDGERLSGFHEADMADLAREMSSPSPTYKDLEETLLGDELANAARGLGDNDPYVKALLGDGAAAAAAHRAIAGTRLDDAAFRKELLGDKGKAVLTSKDTMIQLALRAEPTLRDTQKAFRDHVDAVETEALTLVAKAGFAVYGEETYPDATGTLRLAFGKVAGYPFATTLVPPFTTFYGLFDRAAGFGNRGDFAVPPMLAKHKAEVELSTPLNLVCTADITGGNSGSPVVDKNGRLVGLVFDGNMQSHPNTFVYDEAEARCVAVDIRGILESLRNIYGAGALADELVQGSRKL